MKLAKDVMTSKIVTISSDETIARAVSSMDKHDVKEVPVVDEKNELIGEITYYDILDSPRTDADAKVHTLLIKPPTAVPESDLSDIARLIIDSGVEAVPIIKERKLVGIVSDYDILKESMNDKRIKDLKVKEIMRTPPRFFHGDEPISTARRIMRYTNVDRLPVVTEDGRSLGMILSMDILRAFYRGPTEKVGPRDRIGGIVSPLNLPIKGFMRTDIPEVHMDELVPSVVKKMLEKHLRGLQVLDNNNKVVGLVFRLDVLDRLFEKKYRDGVWVNFSGEPLPYDTVEAVKEYITSDVKRIKILLPSLVSVDIHIKKIHAATPDKWNYEANVSLVKSSGNNEIISALYGYNIMFTLKDALEKLIKKLERKYKERRGKTY